MSQQSRSASTRDLVHSCERVEVSCVVVVEGAGIDGDPIREVAYWYSDDGRLIARRDAWEEERALRPMAAPGAETQPLERLWKQRNRQP